MSSINTTQQFLILVWWFTSDRLSYSSGNGQCHCTFGYGMCLHIEWLLDARPCNQPSPPRGWSPPVTGWKRVPARNQAPRKLSPRSSTATTFWCMHTLEHQMHIHEPLFPKMAKFSKKKRKFPKLSGEKRRLKRVENIWKHVENIFP